MTVVQSGRTRVLLIDDDEKLNALVGEYLGRFNFAVHAVVHPDEGLRALRVDPPDIVILDVMLPDMDGFAVCRKVRERSSVPIIMLTARGEVAASDRRTRAGCGRLPLEAVRTARAIGSHAGGVASGRQDGS